MMRLELLLLGLILAILGLAMVIHKTCLDRIYHRVRKTTDGNFEMEELKKHLELPQGSNFNTMMLLSWLLFSSAWPIYSSRRLRSFRTGIISSCLE